MKINKNVIGNRKLLQKEDENVRNQGRNNWASIKDRWGGDQGKVNSR